MDGNAPRVVIEPFATQTDRERWLVTWRLVNLSGDTLRLVSAIQPHSQFRTEETPLLGEVAPAASTEITLPVRFREPSGAIVENPFLIVRVDTRDGEWNVLARVRVRAGANGAPEPASPVVVTVNRAAGRPT